MSDHQYKFNVTMTCGGCSGAVERVLKRLEGVYIPLRFESARCDLLLFPRQSDPSCYRLCVVSVADAQVL